MKKIMVVLLALTLLFSSFTMAEETNITYDFEEDFENYVDSMVVEQGAGTITILEEEGNHFMRCITNAGEADNGYFHCQYGPVVEDFDLELRVRPYNIKNPDYHWIKICYRADPGPIKGEREAYIFEIWDWRGNLVKKSDSQRITEAKKYVENEDFYFDGDTWYSIRIEGRDNTFTCWVDDELLGTMVDDGYFRNDGSFALCSWGADFDIDDIRVVKY